MPVVARLSTLQYHSFNRSVNQMKIYFGFFLKATVKSRSPYGCTTVHGFIYFDQVGLWTDHDPLWHNDYVEYCEEKERTLVRFWTINGCPMIRCIDGALECLIISSKKHRHDLSQVLCTRFCFDLSPPRKMFEMDFRKCRLTRYWWWLQTASWYLHLRNMCVLLIYHNLFWWFHSTI